MGERDMETREQCVKCFDNTYLVNPELCLFYLQNVPHVDPSLPISPATMLVKATTTSQLYNILASLPISIFVPLLPIFHTAASGNLFPTF